MWPGYAMTERDVCLGWVHAGTVRAEFADSVLNLILSCPRVGRYETFNAGPHLAIARNAVCDQFLGKGGEPWLWMIDTDLAFEPALLEALLAAADPGERPVMSGLYWTTTGGGFPLTPLIYDRHRGQVPEFVPCRDWPPGAVIRVDGCGGGCLLIHRRALEAIREAEDGRPAWFVSVRDGGREYGEDLSFCLRLAAARIPLHADTGAIAGHVKPVMLWPPVSMDRIQASARAREEES